MAPVGTPKPIVDRLGTEVRRAIADAEFNRKLTDVGVEPATSTPAELSTMMKSEIKRWSKVIKDAGITAVAGG
jgi:tripartite-type tricarboxylate transporter receptor subunit TctC